MKNESILTLFGLCLVTGSSVWMFCFLTSGGLKDRSEIYSELWHWHRAYDRPHVFLLAAKEIGPEMLTVDNTP